MDAKWFRNSFLWLLVMVFVLAIAFQVIRSQNSQTKTINATGGKNSLVDRLKRDFLEKRCDTVTQDGDSISLQSCSGNGTKYETTISDRLDITQFLAASGVPLKKPAFQKYVQIKYAQPS